jgi:hypothetical protein
MSERWSDPEPMPEGPLEGGGERGRYPAYIEEYFWPERLSEFEAVTGKKRSPPSGDIRQSLSAVFVYLKSES